MRIQLRPFEIGLIAVFATLAILALIILGTFDGGADDEVRVGPVMIWGTLPTEQVQPVINTLIETSEDYDDVMYREINEDVLSNSLTNALADGVAPDLLLLPHELLIETRRRIAPISYDSFPLRDLRSSYIDGAEIFALADGVYAYPLLVDPLMLYWNRNMLGSAGFLGAPGTWEELVNQYVPALTVRNFDRTITESAVALGGYQNIENASGILATLLLQSGSLMVTNTVDGYSVRLNESVNMGRPLTTTLDFYTRFSRPSNSLYSWNRTFNSDRQSFTAEELALYFGYASEGRLLERQNPNLNFDIAAVPQGATASISRNYGRHYGLAFLRGSRNPAGAAIVANLIASPQYVGLLSGDSGMAPAYRSLVAGGSNDTYGRLSYQSAVTSFGWLSPGPTRVDNIFEQMIRDVLEGRRDESGAAVDAANRLQLEYN